MDSRLYEIPAYQIGNSRPIRRFVDSGLQESINRALAGIDAGKHGNVILHGDLEGNASLTTVANLNDHWSIVASVARPSGGKIEGEGAIVFSW